MLIDELKEALSRLRRDWPDHWPGLPLVLAQCLERLHEVKSQGPSLRYQQLRSAAEDLARRVEAVHAGMAAQAIEAAYHNRLHFADTLWCMTALLLASRKIASASGSMFNAQSGQAGGPNDAALPSSDSSKDLRIEQEMLVMLVIVTHDFEHDGRVNQYPMEMEKHSASRAASVLRDLGLSESDIASVRRLVERTDPLSVTENHQRALQNVFDLSDEAWLQVLANEADIFASALPEFGESLGEALSKEWSKKHSAMAQSVISAKGRLFFLEKVAIFSTPASRYLGLQALRQQQIEALKNKLPVH
jgi:hypothetical protein